MTVKRIVLGRSSKAWTIVLGVAAVGALIGALIGFGGQTVYTAHASMYVTPPASSTPTDAVMAGQYAANRTQLYLELIGSNELARRVASNLGISESPLSLAGSVSATSVHQTSILALEARGSSPDEARSLANAYVKELPAYAQAVERNSGLREEPPMAPVVLPMSVSSNKSGITPWLPVLGGAALLGIPAVLTVWSLRRRHPVVRDVKSVRAALSVPFVEAVGDEAEINRVMTMLLTTMGSTRLLLIASPRNKVSTARFVTRIGEALDHAGISYDLISVSDLADFTIGDHSQNLVVVDVPGMLDQSPRLENLTNRPVSAVIVARRGQTLLEDVVDLQRHFAVLKFEDVKGVVVERFSKTTRAARGPTEVGARVDGQPWPTIDVLEEDSIRQSGRRRSSR